MPENTPRSSFLSISIIVLLLLAVIVLGYFYATSPSESQLDSARQDITALEGRLETVRDELARAHDELTAARSDISRLDQENRDLRSQFDERRDAARSLDDCEAELARVEAALHEANIRLAELEAAAATNATKPVHDALEACRKNAAETAAELDKAKMEIAALREEVETLRAGANTEAAGTDTKATRCEEDMAALKQELASVRSERDEIAGQLVTMQEARQQVADKLAECQESRLAATRGQDELQSTLRDMKSEYQNLVDSLRQEIGEKSVVIEQIEDRLSINILGEILFSLGSRRLRPEGRELLADVAENLSPAPGDVVYVIGHTDTVPIAAEFRDIFPSNWDLSAARAASVARYLLEREKIDPERIAVMGMAEHHPIADNDTAKGRARNRRVEILIGPELYGK